MRAIAKSWVPRAVVAGIVGSLLGAGVCTANYLTLPGAMRIDWALMFPIVVAYAGLCGTLGGLGIGAGMRAAAGRDPDSVGAMRLVLGATIGALLGGLLPAVVGVAGFGSLSAPYAGTGNLVGSILLAVSAFSALWAPALDGRPGRGLLLRWATSAVASVTVAAALAGLIAGLTITLDIVPDYDVLSRLSHDIGLVPMAALSGAVVLVGVGAFMGLSMWMHLTLMLAVERLRSRGPRQTAE